MTQFNGAGNGRVAFLPRKISEGSDPARQV